MEPVDTTSPEIQRGAFFEQIVKDLENKTGVSVYRVPREHELSNLRGYTNDDDSFEGFQEKVDLTTHIPTECFTEDKTDEKRILNRAWVLLPTTKSLIQVEVGNIQIDGGSHIVTLSTYLVDPVKPEAVNYDQRASFHQRDYITEDDYEVEFNKRKRELPVDEAEREIAIKSIKYTYLTDSRDATILAKRVSKKAD